MEKPAWYIASLLMILVMIMLGHLAFLIYNISLCNDLIVSQMEWIRERIKDPSLTEFPTIPGSNIGAGGCSSLEEVFQRAVREYLAVVLALMTGGAAGAIVERTRHNAVDPTKKDDKE